MDNESNNVVEDSTRKVEVRREDLSFQTVFLLSKTSDLDVTGR